MRLRRVLPLLAVSSVVLWMLGRAAVSARLDRDLLARELGRQLGQPVTLRDYTLAWDGHVRIDDLTVGNLLKVRRADTVLPWGEVVRGEIHPRRLTLTEPDLTLRGDGPAAPPPFPVAFQNATLRWSDRPPVQPLNGEIDGDRLEVSHPQAGTWRKDKNRLRVENLSLRWLSEWLGRPLPLPGPDRASATVTLDSPWQAELELPYGNVTVRPEGPLIVATAPSLKELREVEVRLDPSAREVTRASALTPWGRVTVAGHLGEQAADANVTFPGGEGTLKGPWSDPRITAKARVAGLSLQGNLTRRGGQVTGPQGLAIQFADGSIRGALRPGVPLQGRWKGSTVHVEARGLPVLQGQANATLDADALAQTATLQGELPRWRVHGFPGPAARFEAALANGTWRPVALEFAGVKPPVAVNGTLNPLKVDLVLAGQNVTGTKAFGTVHLEGSVVQARLELKPLQFQGMTVELARLDVTGPPWRGTVDVPALKLPGVNGTLTLQARLPDQLKFSATELAWQGRKFPLAGTVNGTLVKVTRPWPLQGRYLPKLQKVALTGQLKAVSLKEFVPTATGNLTGTIALKAGLQGGSGTFQGQVAHLQVDRLQAPSATVKARLTPGKPLSLAVGLPKPRWGERAVPPLQAQLLLVGTTTTIQRLTIGCVPPQVASGQLTPEGLFLTSALKAAPLSVLPFPVAGTATGNLTVKGQSVRFAGTTAELEGWGFRLGNGKLSVNATQPPLAFTARGSGFQPERLNFLNDRFPGLHGSLRFVATEKEAEVHLEGMSQGKEFLPGVSVWLSPAGAVRKLLVLTTPQLELAGTLQPLELKGQLTGQSLSELIRLAGGRPNPEIGMRLTGPVTLTQDQLTFQGTVQELTYRKAPLGSGRLTLTTAPALDGRLVLDRPLSVGEVASVGLAPPALRNPLAQILGGTLFANVRVTGVRLQGSLDAPRLTPEFSGL